MRKVHPVFLTGIGFDVDVVVVEVPTDNATVTSVNDAYESITKNTKKRQYIQLKLVIHYRLLHRIMDLQCLRATALRVSALFAACWRVAARISAGSKPAKRSSVMLRRPSFDAACAQAPCTSQALPPRASYSALRGRYTLSNQRGLPHFWWQCGPAAWLFLFHF